MHHALRRDFVTFLAAVQNTPISEHGVWAALERRWLLMADVLHHHHSAEDDELWPLLQRHAEEAGAEEDLRMLADMEAEHERHRPRARDRAARRSQRWPSTRAPITATPSRSG